MKRIERSKREGALRKLLRELTVPKEGCRIWRVQHRFGAIFHRQSGLWHIFNSGSNNVIATVNLTSVPPVILYRPASHYRHVLENFLYGDETIHAPSNNMGRRSQWARENLQGRIQESLAREQQVHPRFRYNATVLPAPGLRLLGISLDEKDRVRDSRGRYVSWAVLTPEQRDWARRALLERMRQRAQRGAQRRAESFAQLYNSSPSNAIRGRAANLVWSEVAQEIRGEAIHIPRISDLDLMSPPE